MSKKVLRMAMKNLRDVMVSLRVPSHLDYKDMNSYQLILNKDKLLNDIDNYMLDNDLYYNIHSDFKALIINLSDAVSVVKGLM